MLGSIFAEFAEFWALFPIVAGEASSSLISEGGGGAPEGTSRGAGGEADKQSKQSKQSEQSKQSKQGEAKPAAKGDQSNS